MINRINGYLAALVTGAIIFSLSGCFSSRANFEPSTNSSDSPNPSTTETISLNFGVYTADKPTEVVKQFRPLLNAIEAGMTEGMGKPVKIKMKVAKTYEKGIENIATGKVDFSRLGPASYIEATAANPDLSILAVESKGGEKVFYGIIAVNKNSPIQNVQQLKGKSFAFGDELSTIGRFLSQQYLLNNGIKASNLGRYEYLERHDKVGTAVGLGQFDAGALKEGTFKKLVDKGVSIREIARFPNVQKPWISRSGLPEEIFEQLQSSLVNMTDQNALESIKREGFVAGSDADYTAIRKAVQNNSKFFE